MDILEREAPAAPLIPVNDARTERAGPVTIEGVAREIIPATPPRDGSYVFTTRRRISVAPNRW